METKYKSEERRKHGCDGCREEVPTERFNGFCGNNIWLCDDCLTRLIQVGLNYIKD